MTIQAEVTFKTGDSGPTMEVGRMYLNSLPVIDGISDLIVGKVMEKMSFPSDVADAWKAVKGLTAKDGKLILTL